jgi:RNA polymerase sigma-70 factor (ECF subfamily)
MTPDRPHTAPRTAPDESEDVELLAAIRSRDADAFERFYRRHSPVVFAFCVRSLRARDAAEELTLDIFWEIWDRGERYDPTRGTPVAYLLRLTRSRIVDRLRARPRNARAGQAGGDAPVEAAAAPEPQSAPGTRAVMEEQRATVARAMNELTRPQREAIEMAFFDALTHSEIAERLGEPLGTIKSRIRQALGRLREALGGLEI